MRKLMDDKMPAGPGLFEITHANGHDLDARFITSVRRLAGAERAPGTALIGWAAWLLGLLGAGALFVSFSAQYAYVFHVRRQHAASIIEAGLPDVGMIVFSLLRLGLAPARTPTLTH